MPFVAEFDSRAFIHQFWQKKPVLLRGLFKQFVDPIDEHDLAGLAMEEDVDSRIVSQFDGKWHVEQGPFEQFDHVCVGQWSLLVQGVDRYIEDAASLLNDFHFIPRWRIDDLMVSYSVPGAGVGPHVDQYDVFIIQGKGRRHWKVGEKQTLPDVMPHPLLSQVENFESIIDAHLEPGDVLYIPPGFPHCGIAIEPSLNYSVGFRAPSQQEMLSAWADYAIQNSLFERRFSDPDLAVREHSGVVLPDELERLRGFLHETIQSEEFVHWLGEYLSQGDEPVSETETTGCVRAQVLAGDALVRRLDVKPVLILEHQARQVWLCISEYRWSLPMSFLPHLEALSRQTRWMASDLSSDALSEDVIAFMQEALELGFWQWESEQ